jgi:hypothetical protein
MKLETPTVPEVLKLTHFSVHLTWKHFKESLGNKATNYYRFNLQQSNNEQKVWTSIYK